MFITDDFQHEKKIIAGFENGCSIVYCNTASKPTYDDKRLSNGVCAHSRLTSGPYLCLSVKGTAQSI